MKRTFGLLALACCLALAQLPGETDTIGGTTFDNQNSGPALQWLARVPEGVHTTWTFSAQPYGSNWTDRTAQYNFYDNATGSWNWIETNFMNSGLNSQTRRCGYGTLETGVPDNAAVVACHYNTGGMPPQFAPVVTRDLQPGAGIFDECVGAPTLTGYFLTVVGMTQDQSLHQLIIKFAEAENVYYTRTSSWCTWENPVTWQQTGGFGHNLAASHASDKAIATWMTGRGESLGMYTRFSSDAGLTWDNITQLVPPPVYGGDTVTVCARGASVMFDKDDEWMLATTLLPAVGDTYYQNPAELWLYRSAGAQWTKITRAQSGNLAGGFGSNAAICDRPSLGQNPATGRFFVAWEQFDSSNVESSTGLLRADIWLSWSDDGAAWTQPQMLVTQDQTSKRFPCIARYCPGDSVAVGFVQDLVAGFNSDDVGAVSNNPVCVWQGVATGIAEGRNTPYAPRRTLTSDPSPFVNSTTIYLPSGVQSQTVRIHDVTGKLVCELRASGVERTASSVLWDGRDESGVSQKPGCYLARCGALETKLVKSR